MYFKSLRVKNFGPFDSFETSFHPNGVNIVLGQNGSGKTQLIGAMVFSLIGKSVVDIIPDGNLPSEVELVICDDKIREHIYSKYDGKNKNIQVTKSTSNPPKQGELQLANTLRNILKSLDGPQLLLSYDPRVTVSLSAEEIAFLSKIEWETSDLEITWNRIFKNLVSPEILSEGNRTLLVFLKEYIKRKSTNLSIPLIIDDLLPALSATGVKMIGKLLNDICLKDQVILFTFPGLELNIKEENIKTNQEIKRSSSSGISSLTYNYFPRQIFQKTNIREHETQEYVRGQKIQVEENRFYEFKEVKGNNPIRSICSLVDEYAVAFLNMGQKGIGRIYWGVTDDGNVVGVMLNLKDRDELRRLVTEKLHQIEPPVAPSSYEINLYPVVEPYNSDELDLFIVEVKIPSTESEFLFATGKREVFVKTDAGKKKLTPLEIQQEILERHK